MTTSRPPTAKDGAAKLYYETHMHTPFCQHAEGEPEVYAAVAATKGLKGVIVTCHNPVPGGFGATTRMRLDQFDAYLALVERARVAMSGVADVRLGLECDYMPGMEDWLERQLSSAPFDYVLGSVHPHLAEYREVYWTGDALAYQRLYFDHLARAAETGLFDTLAHPDLVKNVTARSWDLSRLIDDVRVALDRIAATGCALELNTSGLSKAVPEMNPGPEILREAALRGIPIVIGGDAHLPSRVGDRFGEALDALEGAGYDEVSLFLGRVRATHAISEIRASLCGDAVSVSQEHV